MCGAREWVQEHIVPVDCYGAAGTVAFYHSRLAHSAGSNYSSAIRQAVLIRFAKTRAAMPDAECLEHARTNDLWREWSDVVRTTPAAGGGGGGGGSIETADSSGAMEEDRKFFDERVKGLQFLETGWYPVVREEGSLLPRL